jgi:hypothetical protein
MIMNDMKCHAYDCNANACVTPECYTIHPARGFGVRFPAPASSLGGSCSTALTKELTSLVVGDFGIWLVVSQLVAGTEHDLGIRPYPSVEVLLIIPLCSP